jgi:S-adenosylmethionine-diacylglycerol 3-amino-3-carboxypropyl transferase
MTGLHRSRKAFSIARNGLSGRSRFRQIIFSRSTYWGTYLTRDAVPDFLRKENLPIIRARLDRIQMVTADAKIWLASRPASSIDAFSLSNICELMSPAETALTFEEIARTSRSGARLCFRNLVIPREVQKSLASKIRLQEDCSRQLLEQDRSFVYSRVQAYVVAAQEVFTRE